jgi:hypothetical protein
MNTSHSKTLTVITILLLALALITSSSFLLTGRLPGNVNRQFNSGNFQPASRNFSGRSPGSFSPFALMRTLGLGGQVFRYISIGISVIAIGLLLISAYGVWKQRRWSLNLGIVLAILFLLGSLPGLFSGGSFFNLTRALINYGRMGASIAIIVMGVLPSVREVIS